MAKLVAIGDSLTQGFHSFAITNTEQSYPALIARSLGLDPFQFRQPDFRGRGGLPCSFEWLARQLEQRYGADLSAFDWLRAVHTIPALLDEVEDYWERGKGTRPTAPVLYHNLAVWGFEVADAYALSAGACRELIGKSRDDVLGIPSHSRLRGAIRVLNPSHDDALWKQTQVSAASAIRQRDGSIDHLIAWMGANNCLRTVVNLKVSETSDTPPQPNSQYTLWSAKAFETDYIRFADEIDAIGATHVYTATVPHVTIPPITRGVMEHRGRLPEDRRYYDYYTRFFIEDKAFNPKRDPRLSGAEAAHIDTTIDAYNATIRREAKQRGWAVVDLCQVLDDLAVRRNHGRPHYALPAALSDLSVRFFEVAKDGGLLAGGLTSLDGIHPTPTGYSLIAHEFLQHIRPHEPDALPIDFADVRRWDALVSSPPRTLDDMVRALATLERYFHISRWLDPT